MRLIMKSMEKYLKNTNYYKERKPNLKKIGNA